MSLLPTTLAPHWRRLEDGRLSLMALIAPIEEHQLRHSPEAGAWSVLEVVEHLSKVDYLILKTILKGEATRPPARTDFAKFIAMMIAMRLPLRYAAPRATRPQAQEASLADLATRWSATRKDWHEYLRQAPLDRRSDIVFVHPRGGGMNLEQTLRWLAAHQLRHLRQIEKLLRNVSKA